MIYVDQPFMTGFSYSSDNSTLEFWGDTMRFFGNFMDKLYDMYPEFVGRPLFFTGESYAAKYFPIFAYYLNTLNEE